MARDALLLSIETVCNMRYDADHYFTVSRKNSLDSRSFVNTHVDTFVKFCCTLAGDLHSSEVPVQELGLLMMMMTMMMTVKGWALGGT